MSVINPPAVKSTTLSSVASLIEPVEEVMDKVPVVAVIAPTFISPKEEIRRSFTSIIETTEFASVAETVTAPTKSLVAPFKVISEFVPAVTSSDVVPVTTNPLVVS